MKSIFLFACMAGALLAQGTQAQRVEKRVIVEDRIEGTAAPGFAARSMVLSTGAANHGIRQRPQRRPHRDQSPYAAEAVNESIQTLYDGNRIVETNSDQDLPRQRRA